MFPRTVELAFARFQRKGDAKALAIVFDRTAPELLRVARHLAPSPADAEDLVQATFLTAIEAAGSFQRGRPVLPWLLGILANHGRQARRSSRRVADPARVRGDVVVDVASDVAAAELQRELAATIGTLPEVYRPVLRLWFEHGLEAHEIAATLERPSGTVRAQVSRGIEMLRRALPHSLAGAAVVTGLAGRGLAAVRADVLGACSGTSSGLASALAIGGLLMLHNKLISVAAVAAIALLSWLTFQSPTDSRPLQPDLGDAPTVASVELARDIGERASDTAERSLVALPVVASVRSAKDAVPEVSTALVVRLVSATDRAPLRGYGVALRPSAELANLALPSRFLASDSAGCVRFDGLEPGGQCIEVDRIGIAAFVTIVEGQTTEHVVEVADSLLVDCEVLDPMGQPVVGADVVVQGSRLAAPRVGVTDALGRVVVEHCNGVELQARKRGYSPSLAYRVQGQAGQRVAVRMQLGEGGRRLSGRAFDAEGSPVVDGVVAVVPAAARQVTPWDRGEPQLRPVWLRTNADGGFETDEVAAGEYLVVVRAPDLEITPAWGDADTRRGDAFIEVRSAVATAVEGRVHKGGEPIAGIRINIWPQECAAEIGYLLNLVGMRSAETDQDGAFRIVGTLPGVLDLQAFRGMETVGQTRRGVAAGETVRWDLDIGGGRELEIRISANRKLPVGLFAYVHDAGKPEQPPALVPISGNGATYSKVRDGAVSVILTQIAAGGSFTQLARRDVAASETAVQFDLRDEDLPVSRISGRLVDVAMAPLGAKTVRASRMDGDGLMVFVVGVTAPDGTFSLGPLPAGHYAILVGEPASAAQVGEVLLTAARDEHAGDLTVEKR